MEGRRATKGPGMLAGVANKDKCNNSRLMTAAQRIEMATVKRSQASMPEVQARDAEALFAKFDCEGTQLLSRGAVVELLRDIGLEKALGEGFSATARLAFDSHSADSHFLALPEFKQLYYRIAAQHSSLLPREPLLTICVLGAKGLPPADANGKSDPFCCVHVAGKPHTKSQTRVVEKTLDPWWGEEFDDKYGYEPGCNIVFEVFDYDKGQKPDLLGRAILPSEEFDRVGGFDGRLDLKETAKGYKPTVRARVVVNALPAVPPNLKIWINAAKGLPPADPNGQSDPFCTCMVVGKPFSKAQTKTKAKTLDPVWNETFDDKYRYEEGDSLLFEVYDFDKGSKCDFLCRATLPGSSFHRPGGFEGWLDLVDGPKGYLPKLQLKVVVLALEPEEDQEEGVEAAAPVAAAEAEAAPPPKPASE
uniref:C2 domain-containing protein n=1 Tax=Alexandrium catenella TaxID=2925 RepID=A0A7S1S6I0_ALECA